MCLATPIEVPIGQSTGIAVAYLVLTRLQHQMPAPMGTGLIQTSHKKYSCRAMHLWKCAQHLHGDYMDCLRPRTKSTMASDPEARTRQVCVIQWFEDTNRFLSTGNCICGPRNDCYCCHCSDRGLRSFHQMCQCAWLSGGRHSAAANNPICLFQVARANRAW
jgi:hypothetical protein